VKQQYQTCPLAHSSTSNTISKSPPPFFFSVCLSFSSLPRFHLAVRPLPPTIYDVCRTKGIISMAPDRPPIRSRQRHHNKPLQTVRNVLGFFSYPGPRSPLSSKLFLPDIPREVTHIKLGLPRRTSNHGRSGDYQYTHVRFPGWEITNHLPAKLALTGSCKGTFMHSFSRQNIRRTK